MEISSDVIKLFLIFNTTMESIKGPGIASFTNEVQNKYARLVQLRCHDGCSRDSVGWPSPWLLSSF